jgi:translation initiation factor 1
MGKKNKKNKKQREQAPQSEPSGGFGGLGAALAAQGFSAKTAGPAQVTPAQGIPAKGAIPTKEASLGKVVVRRERKGRGGKTVTVLEGASIAAADRDAMAKSVRKALGCGARAEGKTIVVQGDQRDSAKAWLEKKGAKVVIGN